MNIVEARAILKAHYTDSLQGNDVVKGLKILFSIDAIASINPGHDQIWYANFEYTVEKMTIEQVTEMHNRHWFEDEDQWSHFC